MPAINDTRARELGLSVLRDGTATLSTLTATVIFKATADDVEHPEHIGDTYHPLFADHDRNSAAVYEGLRVTATYDGHHFYDAICAYHVEGRIFEAHAAAMASTLGAINNALVKQRHDPDGTDLSRHDYPGLVLAVGKILGVSFVEYQLDADCDWPCDTAELADLASAFEQYTPRDTASGPMPF